MFLVNLVGLKSLRGTYSKLKICHSPYPFLMGIIIKRFERLKRSLGRRFRERLLPRGYVRLGTHHGGWWINKYDVGEDPLLIDCGLGEDISFPSAFLDEFGGHVVGIDPNPRSIKYCQENAPDGMEVWQKAFWCEPAITIIFHMPRPLHALPKGADGVSGSLLESHDYVIGGDKIHAKTTSLAEVLESMDREKCDVLKIDIEGAEYEVINRLCYTGEIVKAKQILVEFHHFCTNHTIGDTNRAVERIKRNGFDLIHVEDRNHIFRRRTAP